MLAKTASAPIHLAWTQKDRTVIVSPQDEDRYAMTVEAVIRACQATDVDERFRAQFSALLSRLAEWILPRQDRIAEAWLTARDAGLLFLVVRREKAYDEEFEDALTDLDVKVARDPDFDLVRLSVLALPMASSDAVDSFLAPEVRLKYSHAK